MHSRKISRKGDNPPADKREFTVFSTPVATWLPDCMSNRHRQSRDHTDDVECLAVPTKYVPLFYVKAVVDCLYFLFMLPSATVAISSNELTPLELFHTVILNQNKLKKKTKPNYIYLKWSIQRNLLWTWVGSVGWLDAQTVIINM